MASNIKQLAEKFELKLAPKTAFKRGTQVNAKKILKSLEKTRKTYKDSRERLRLLEAELDRIEGQLQECRDGVRGSRAEMLRMNEILQNMDLTDAQYAVIYDNDEQDVGYIISGDEHYLELDDKGEIRTVPMKEHRRRLRGEKRMDDSSADDVNSPSDEIDMVGPGLPDESPASTEENLDDNYILHPNFRFID